MAYEQWKNAILGEKKPVIRSWTWIMDTYHIRTLYIHFSLCKWAERHMRAYLDDDKYYIYIYISALPMGITVCHLKYLRHLLCDFWLDVHMSAFRGLSIDQESTLCVAFTLLAGKTVLHYPLPTHYPLPITHYPFSVLHSTVKMLAQVASIVQ